MTRTGASLLELWETQHHSTHKHGRMDFVLVKERLAERPESLDDRDIALLDYFGGSQEVQAAFAARDAARRPAAAPIEDQRDGESCESFFKRLGGWAPLYSVGAFVDRIKEIDALNRERNRRIDALERRIAALEAHCGRAR